MADSTPKSYHTDPTLYLYTSLTSGSSHIISATSRMQTILKANRIEFQALDVATDEKARMLWGRRAGKRKLPGLVRFGMIVGDLEEVEEWNEYGELRENVNLPSPAKVAPVTPSPSTTNTPSKVPAPQESTPSTNVVENTSNAPTKSEGADSASESASTSKAGPTSPSTAEIPPPSASTESTLTMAMRQAGFEAAKKAGDAKTKARQEELERLKAKAEDLQNLKNDGPTGMPTSSGTTKTEEAEKPQTGISSAPGAADKVPLAEDGNLEGAAKNATVETKDSDTENTADQTASAAEREMAESANEATKEAAEPEVLEGKGEAEPEAPTAKPKTEPDSAAKEPVESTVKAEPQHIPNAKEAEEEANKAIIADEATHVHIAGSPPPYASPGIRPPKDEEEEDSIPSSSALKDEVENEGTDGSIQTDESKGKLAKEEDETGRVDNIETTVVAKEGDKTEPAAPTEPSDKVEEATTANTEHNKTGTKMVAPAAQSSDNASESTAEPLVEDKSEKAEEPTAPTTGIGESDNASKHEEPPGIATKPTEATDSVEADPNTALHETQDPAEPKTQDQPAASGEKAGESVGD